MSTKARQQLNSSIVIFGGRGMLGQALQQVFPDAAVLGHHDVDITNAEQVQNAIQGAKVVINAAAYTKVDDCETNEALATRVNGVAPGIIAQACAEAGVKLVHYSTDYVFDGTKADGYNEVDVPTVPVNAYGRSKLAGEQAIQAVGGEYYILRTAWLYGQGGPNFVDTISRLAAERTELKVVNDQHGSPTFTVDLAKQTKKLLEGNYQPGIYHTTNAEACTWHEFAKAIVLLQPNLSCTVNPCTSAEFPRPAKRPTYSILNNTKLPAMQTWRDALTRYLTKVE